MSGCTVSGPGMEFEMPGEDPAHFPDLPTFTDDKYHELPAGMLRDMIRRTAFAAADESARYSMTGVLWELEDSHVRLVATDGKRLALTSGSATGHGGHTTKGQTPVVPTKAMTLLDRNLHDDSEVVRVSLRPNDALFRTDTAVIYSRLVEGRYPNYRDVFPKKPGVRVAIPVTPFLLAVRQAAIMTEEDSKRVVFHFAKGKLTLEAQGAATGRSKVELPLDYDGTALDISFNPAYLTEMLKVLPSDAELTLDLVDGASPALFKQEPNYSYLVMPLT
jgi:DNA polymerase-3 subunit beta